MSEVKWQKPLALAILLSALGYFAYWLEYSHTPSKENEKEAKEKIFSLSDSGIKSIQVNATFVFECSNSDMVKKPCKTGDTSDWTLGGKTPLKADSGNINSLTSSMNHLRPSSTLSLKEETPEKRAQLLKDYGLNSVEGRIYPGRSTVEVTTVDGKTIGLTLGETHPFGESDYGLMIKEGKPDTDTVYLVPSYFRANLNHNLTHWRSKSVHEFKERSVKSFVLSGPRDVITATRKDTNWTLTSKNFSKDPVPGDIENIDGLLTVLAQLKAKNFISESKDSFDYKKNISGTKNIASIKLQFETGPEIEYKIFEPKNKGRQFVTVSGELPLFEVESNFSQKLDKTLNSLRLLKLFTTVERYQIKQIEIGGKPVGNPPLITTELKGKWDYSMKENKPEGDLDGGKMISMLDRLSGNRIHDYFKPANTPKGESEGLTLVLKDSTGKVLRKLLIWKIGEKLAGRNLIDRPNEAFSVDPAIKEVLPWERNALSRGFGPSPKPESKNPLAEGLPEPMMHSH